jgi:hypothetical protein
LKGNLDENDGSLNLTSLFFSGILLMILTLLKLLRLSNNGVWISNSFSDTLVWYKEISLLYRTIKLSSLLLD